MKSLIIIALMVFAVKIGITTCKNFLYPFDYQDIIVKYANQNDLDEALVMAVIKTESNFVHDAHSGKASGLMQITDDTAEWITKKMNIKHSKIDLMEPKDNIMLGCYYLRYLIDRYDGNVDVALAAYNGGPGNVDKWLDEKKYSSDGIHLSYIPFKETREYVEKVNTQKIIYEKMISGEEALKNYKK